MQRRQFLEASLVAATAANLSMAGGDTEPAEAKPGAHRASCDTLVYGSTPGGIAAAVEAARRGDRVVLACPKGNPGGMAASGLSTTDAVRRNLFGGFVIEFISRVRNRYRQILGNDQRQWKLVHDGWYYEPSVAEQVFREILAGEEDRLQWLPRHWLREATVEGNRIAAVELEGPQGKAVSFSARTFIDGTYEGDLAARADVPYRVGREGRDEYGESKAGIHYMNWRTGEQIVTADTGEPSIAIQAFCARSIFTDDPEHRLPIEKPSTYDQHLSDYLPLIDDFRSGRLRRWGWGTPLPRRKFQMSVLRMEPVWMTTGQVAGLAASVAREKSCHVAQLDPAPLPKTLRIQTQPAA